VIPNPENLQRAGEVIAGAFAGHTAQLDLARAAAVLGKATAGIRRPLDDLAAVVAKFHQED
jgi:hypothetical protein